jgi:hypothetical protein
MSSIPHPRRRRHLLGSGLVASALATLAAVLLSATPASADPPRADLVVGATADPTEIVYTGGSSTVTVDVRNVGTKASEDISLAVSLPAGTWFAPGFVAPASWQCDLQGTATCTRAPLAAGASAEPLRIPLGVPAGTAGDVLTVSATASTNAESSIANNTGQATVRYIPGTVDLELNGSPTNDSMINGEVTGLSLSLRNSGTSPSGDVTVVAPLPAGLSRYSEGGDGWDCAFGGDLAAGQPGWRCTHGPLQAGENTSPFGFYATVAGTPGDVITMTATAATTSTETTLDNNTQQNTVTVLQPATIRGTVWVDSDRDGIRDAGEPGAPPGPGGIDHIVVDAQTVGQPGTLATVNPDGTYVAQVRPGTHRVEFYVQDPYSYIDSADSDLVYYNNYSAPNRYGYSDWITLAGGEETVIDAAVRSKYLTPPQ